MTEKKKVIRTLLKYTFVATVVSIVVFVSYIRFGGYVFISKPKRTAVISDIQSAPKLPDNFMRVFNALYPEAMTNSGWKYAVGDVVSGKYSECPCRDAAIIYGVSRMHGAFFYITQLNFVLEDNLSQQQCLNKILERTDFTGGVIGIENAAQSYFNKPLKQLNEDEVLEIIVRLQNPSLYRKERPHRHQLFMGRFQMLKEKLEEQKAR